MTDSLVHSSKIHGEPKTGFEKRGKKGPFECGNCQFFRADGPGKDSGSCGQEDMMKDSEYPKRKDGRVIVDDVDCCEFVDRIGKTKLRKVARNWMKRGETNGK